MPNKVQSGEPIQLRAADWNAFVDVANSRPGFDQTAANSHTSPQPGFVGPTDRILMCNTSGESRRRFEVLQIGNPITNTPQIVRPCFSGSLPTTHPCILGVLLDYASYGTIVEAQITGLCTVLVRVGSAAHRRAMWERDSATLVSGFAGPVELVWKPESGPAERLCTAVLRSPQSPMYAWVPNGIEAGIAHQDAVTPGIGNGILYDWNTSTEKWEPVYDGYAPAIIQIRNPWPSILPNRLVKLSAGSDGIFTVDVERCYV